MYFPLRIATRYFIAKKKAAFINLISWLAIAGIAFGTAAIIIVLSVFNGLEDLNKSLFRTFDSDLIILPITGKKIDSSILTQLKSRKLSSIIDINGILQENALVKYADQQCVATIKGVPESFLNNSEFKKSLVEGEFILNKDSTFQAIVGIGIQQNLSIDTKNFYTPIEFWFPNKNANLNLATENSFNKIAAFPSSIFSIEQSYDNYVIVPIELTKRLFGRDNELSSIEINLKENSNFDEAKKYIKQIIGLKVKVLTRDEQHVGLLKAIKFEKLFVFLALIFITGIAALNIFFSLSMLVIEKTEDIKILKAIGATNNTIKRIFQIEGAIISIIGAVLGMAIGLGICVLQLKYSFLKIGMVSALVDAYPVRIEANDVILTGIALILITMLISQFPSKKASKIN